MCGYRSICINKSYRLITLIRYGFVLSKLFNRLNANNVFLAYIHSVCVRAGFCCNVISVEAVKILNSEESTPWPDNTFYSVLQSITRINAHACNY